MEVTHRRSWLGLAGLLILGALAQPSIGAATGQNPPPTDGKQNRAAPTLENGLAQPVMRELKGGETHSYNLALPANTYLYAVVEQKGIDAVVRLYDPEGKQLVEVDSPNGTNGPEPLFWVTDRAGTYRLEVGSLEKDAKPGNYEARLVENRPVTKADTIRLTAQKTMAEADQFRRQATRANFLKAIEKYQECLAGWHALGEKEKEAQTLNYMGLVFGDLGEKQKAVESLSEALVLRRALGDQLGQAQSLNNIGMAYRGLGNPEKALESYLQGLSLVPKTGNRSIEIDLLGNLGYLYSSFGDTGKALESFTACRALCRSIGDRNREAQVLVLLGNLNTDLGENGKALDYLAQALPVIQASGNRYGEAVTLINLSQVHRNLGNLQKFLDYNTQALPLLESVGDREGMANVLINLGDVYSERGDKQKAIESFQRALAVHQALKNPTGQALTLLYLGKALHEVGKNEQALEVFAQALPLFQTLRHRTGQSGTLNQTGNVYLAKGEKAKALEYYTQALPLSRSCGDRKLEAANLFNLAKVKRDLGQLSEAKTHIEEALKLVEQTRSGVASQELRASYLAKVQDFYALYIDVLVQLDRQQPTQGYGAQALQVSESARARSLLELLQGSRTNLSQSLDPQLEEKEGRLKDRLKTKLNQLTALLNRKHPEEAETAAKKEIDELTEEYRRIQAEIRQKNPRYAALTQPQPLTAKDIQQQVLAPEMLLLEYALGPERSYLFAVTQTTFDTYELPGQAVIERQARQVYDLLTARNRFSRDETAAARQARIAQAETDFLPAATALSQLILGPVAGQLGRKQLLLVADGALQYIPFAALPEPEEARVKGQGSGGKQHLDYQERNLSPQSSVLSPLIVSHEIVSLPSASALAILRQETEGRKPPDQMLAVLADPVFGGADDERVRPNPSKTTPPASGQKPEPSPDPTGDLVLARILEREEAADPKKTGSETPSTPSAKEPVKFGFRIPRLPATRIEAEGIFRLADSTRSLKALDFNANRAVATSGELSRYKYVHFATHGFLDSERPELSALVLSMMDETGQPQNGFVRGLEVYNLNLPAELVVLSACETGLGKEIKGEGLVGLTRGFMYAGTKRIVVSLWSVSDAATAELMTAFYRQMLKAGQRPAAALRAAQLELWKSRKWNAPFYWAPFILQGEYR